MNDQRKSKKEFDHVISGVSEIGRIDFERWT